MKTASQLIVLSLVLGLSGCESSPAPDLTTKIEAEAETYYRASTPNLRLESSTRRLNLLDELEVLNDPRYTKFIAIQRFTTYVKIFRWNHALGNELAAKSALMVAEKIRSEHQLSAFSGLDLLDTHHYQQVIQWVDELDAGYAGPEH